MSTISPSGPRMLLRRLRELMAGAGSAQERMDQLVKVIAANMVAEVCSIYILRSGLLELFATEGLNLEAVHKTTLAVGEGLVGMIAASARPLALSEAQTHPNFAYRPETGEEIYHSLMGVPLLSGGRVVGVVAVQNRTARRYSEDELEVMQTLAMVLAEMVNGALSAEVSGIGSVGADGLPRRLEGVTLNDGLASGIAVLHEPRIIVYRHVADDIASELERLDKGVRALRLQIDNMLKFAAIGPGGESREILETYRMFANDRGWLVRLHDAVRSGLTAEAAVERVQVDNRTRMAEIQDAYLRERLHDLEDLSNRLMRHLTGRNLASAESAIPKNAVLVARNMGPAELLDYDISRIKALLLEEGSPMGHVAIVAKSLQVPSIGRIDGLIDVIEAGDEILVDGEHGQVFVRPSADVLKAFSYNLNLREQREAKFAALRDKSSVTRDGTKIALNINAGLLADLQHLGEAGADGIGLYRTELHFMVRATLPKVRTQRELYARVLDQAGERPVVFRTLDVGGDKVLPYLGRFDDDQNPAMGWRAIRLSLDRPVLLRMQLRALLQAAANRCLYVMFPMIAELSEFVAARELLNREIGRLERLNNLLPNSIKVGTMLEVPSLAWQLDTLLPNVDFLSIGSNDLMQFFFASDRGNPRLARRYDILNPAALNLLRYIVRKCDAAEVPVSLCGEAAGRPVEALALLGIGLRNISMAAGSVGAVKALVRNVDIDSLQSFVNPLIDTSGVSIRSELTNFAQKHDLVI